MTHPKDATDKPATPGKPAGDSNDWFAERIEHATEPPRTHGRPTGILESDKGLEHGDANESRRGEQ